MNTRRFCSVPMCRGSRTKLRKAYCSRYSSEMAWSGPSVNDRRRHEATLEVLSEPRDKGLLQAVAYTEQREATSILLHDRSWKRVLKCMKLVSLTLANVEQHLMFVSLRRDFEQLCSKSTPLPQTVLEARLWYEC